MSVDPLSLSAHLVVACIVGLAGLIVAMAMYPFLQELLPPIPVFGYAALQGAGLAGLVCADLFGHRGLTGVLCSTLGAAAVTLLGAMIGGVVALLAMSVGDGSSSFEMFYESVLLGPLALMFAATSGWPIPVWIACMVALHPVARRIRATDLSLTWDQFT